jgi:hypothetical protein
MRGTAGAERWQLKRSALGGNDDLMRINRSAAVTVIALLSPRIASAQGSPPPDRPFWTDSAASVCIDKAIVARIDAARKTLPKAKARFLAGLPKGYSFAVTTRLRDPGGRPEQVFVLIDSVVRNLFLGRLAQVDFTPGFHAGQWYAVPDSAVLDWTITRTDGIEEGNYVGKFLDSLQDSLQQRGAIKRPC